MSFGKIFSYEVPLVLYCADVKGNPRTTALLTIAKINGLDVQLVPTAIGKDVSLEYVQQHHPLGKVCGPRGVVDVGSIVSGRGWIEVD
jgi:elongation factor 1-gamma